MRWLDYGCGFPVLCLYLNSFGIETAGYDNWTQLPMHVAKEFLQNPIISQNKEFSPENVKLLTLDEIDEYQPNIISVAGIWVEDLEIYEIPTVEYVLSDPLYNSGRITSEGVYHYKKDWHYTPEKFGFALHMTSAFLDVYRRL